LALKVTKSAIDERQLWDNSDEEAAGDKVRMEQGVEGTERLDRVLVVDLPTGATNAAAKDTNGACRRPRKSIAEPKKTTRNRKR